MKVGEPFNPYQIFQGAFAPYWLLEDRGISAGAKLCYIRLLGFAGKDARCYPSLEKLSVSLGVSERQARNYVKELESVGLIIVERRGLRKTNAYHFVWTAELEHLSNSVPDRCDDFDEIIGGTPQGSSPDRKDRSGQDQNCGSAPERNSSSVPDRNTLAAPIGINSPGISSLESSSSSDFDDVREGMRKNDVGVFLKSTERVTEVGQTISSWANERGIQRLRTDRRVGLPEKEHLVQWSSILEQRGIDEAALIFSVLDSAVAAAHRLGEWRSWAYLTLQIQLAAERAPLRTLQPASYASASVPVDEDPACDWAVAKAKIREQIGEIPFMNWFAATRQVERSGARIAIAVSDEPSREYLETEYGNVTQAALAELGINQTTWLLRHPDEQLTTNAVGMRPLALANCAPAPISPTVLSGHGAER